MFGVVWKGKSLARCGCRGEVPSLRLSCRLAVEQTCGRPAMCETGTVPEKVRRLDLPLLSRDGSIIWGSYAMALPTGYRNETPASRRDATGIQWYSVDRLQTDGQGPPSLEVPQHTRPKQGESGMVVGLQHGAEDYLALSLTVRERAAKNRGSRAASARERECQAPDNDRACLERL